MSPTDSPAATDPTDIAANLAQIRARIASACARADRPPDAVRLLPVSKTQPAERLRAAFAAGCSAFGENKVQEALEKAQALADLPIRWCLIGHLQTNKAKYAARFVDEFQALDSLRLAETLDRRLQSEGRGMDVYIEVNTSGEASKFGLAPDAVPGFVAGLKAFASLRPRGLMTLAINSADREAVRGCFRDLRALAERVRDTGAADETFNQLSMGMSGDFELAIEEGATVVRVGQAIFGARQG